MVTQFYFLAQSCSIWQYEIFKKNCKKTEIFHEIFQKQKNMFFFTLCVCVCCRVVSVEKSSAQSKLKYSSLCYQSFAYPGPVKRGGKGGKFSRAPQRLGPHRRSKILKMVFQMASFWPKICIKSIFGEPRTPLGELTTLPEPLIGWWGDTSPHVRSQDIQNGGEW